MRIKFFVSNIEMAPTTISAKLIANALIKRGYDVEIVNDYQRKKEILLKKDAEMIIFQKKIYPGHGYNDVKDLKGYVKLIYIDDDFVGMDDPIALKTLNLSDLVLVGNEVHAQKLKKYVSTSIEAITSISDFENYRYKGADEKNNNPLIISWQQNLADVYIDDLKTIEKPIKEIYDKYNIELRLYGWHEGKHYGVPDRRNKVKEFWPFAKFISFEQPEVYLRKIVPDISNSDIGILPYVYIEERYGKSGFGLRRMMMMGVPMVVSNFGYNTTLIKDGINGFLANTEEEWYSKLEILILNHSKRKEFSLLSKKLIEDEFSYDKTTDKFINAINKHFSLKK